MSKWKQLILSQHHAGLDIYYKSMLKANKPDFTPANIQQAVAKIFSKTPFFTSLLQGLLLYNILLFNYYII